MCTTAKRVTSIGNINQQSNDSSFMIFDGEFILSTIHFFSFFSTNKDRPNGYFVFTPMIYSYRYPFFWD